MRGVNPWNACSLVIAPPVSKCFAFLDVHTSPKVYTILRALSDYETVVFYEPLMHCNYKLLHDSPSLLRLVVFVYDVEGTAHCANMYPASPLDPPQLSEARKQIQHHIMLWLQTDSRSHHLWLWVGERRAIINSYFIVRGLQVQSWLSISFRCFRPYLSLVRRVVITVMDPAERKAADHHS